MTGVVGALAEAWGEVRVHKIRVVLSLVGVFLAVFAMTAVTALGRCGPGAAGAGGALQWPVGDDLRPGLRPDDRDAAGRPPPGTPRSPRCWSAYGITGYASIGYGRRPLAAARRHPCDAGAAGDAVLRSAAPDRAGARAAGSAGATEGASPRPRGQRGVPGRCSAVADLASPGPPWSSAGLPPVAGRGSSAFVRERYHLRPRGLPVDGRAASGAAVADPMIRSGPPMLELWVPAEQIGEVEGDGAATTCRPAPGWQVEARRTTELGGERWRCCGGRPWRGRRGPAARRARRGQHRAGDRAVADPGDRDPAEVRRDLRPRVRRR